MLTPLPMPLLLLPLLVLLLSLLNLTVSPQDMERANPQNKTRPVHPSQSRC